MTERRPYKSDVRAQRAAQTRARIVGAAQELFVDPSEHFTVERVAAMADVSVQTVLRAFGNRDGLVYAAIGTFRSSHGSGDPEPVAIEPFDTTAAAVTSVFDDYESIGDRVVRMLAEEHRIAGFAEVAATGRRMHRRWVDAAFATRLPRRASRRRTEMLTALVAATDVYVWKLLRRDLALGRAAAEQIVVRLVDGVLDDTKGE
jgi:AcrR family transcriptional regulator